jgi:serine/threonine-protein kinase
MILRLVVVDGPETGRSFTFDQADSFLIGRSPKAHLVLDPKADQYISRTHCLVDIRPPRCIVNDLGSTNGTFVNGEKVRRAEVGDGDELRVGRTRIRILVEGVEAPVDVDTRPSIPGAERSADNWQPPSPADSWSPPGPVPEVVDVPPTAEPPRVEARLDQVPVAADTEPNLECWICQTDLRTSADSDGRAAELPDAVYLCQGCEESMTTTGRERRAIGPYNVLGELGRGGMGVVSKAVHRPTRRLCAIKQILPEATREEKVFRLFEREMAIQAEVRHPNLVRLLDHGRDRGGCYFVVEFLPGGDANKLVRTVFKGPVQTRLAIRIVLEVLDGLDALHQRGFVHRDLKPGNILLARTPRDGFGRAKITDYGLAKSFEEAGNSLFDLTREGEAAGSLMFMPPEQMLNYRYVRPPADVYAAGVTLYYLLTAAYSVDCPSAGGEAGHSLFAGRTRNPIEALLEDPAIPIRTRREDLPPRLATVVDTAVEKELSRRYPSASGFRQELAAAARAEGLL